MTETATVKRVTPKEFVKGWNAVHQGTAVYTERSDGTDAKLDVKVGEKPPQTKRGVAAYFGMKVNAVANRETQARKGLIKSGVCKAPDDEKSELPGTETVLYRFNTKRGRQIDWANVAEDVASEANAEAIAAE